MQLLQLVSAYCRAKNLDYKQYLTGLFHNVTEKNISDDFIVNLTRLHKNLLEKAQ